MSKQEFLDGLRAALAGRMGASLIAENVNYYDDYINTQVRMGRGESDVVRELGDPRLIAKSIAEANKHAGAGAGNEATYQDTGDGYAGNGYTGNNYAGNGYSNSRYSGGYAGYSNEGSYRKKAFKIPGWLIFVLIMVVVFVVMSLAFSVLSFFMPIILPLLLIGMVVKFFRST